MLASAEQQLRDQADPRRAAEIVVAVHGGTGPIDVARAAQRIGRELGVAFAHRSAVVLLLAEGEPIPGFTESSGSGGARLLAWSHPGQGHLEASLRAAASFGASALAMISAQGEDGLQRTASDLLTPVLEAGFDWVAPCYSTHRFEGVLVTGIVYPLVRALFGKRLRQPLVEEMALSRGLIGHLLNDAWQEDHAYAGEHVWMMATALAGDFRVCQLHLGVRPLPGPEAVVDLAASLTQVLGSIFHEMRVLARPWQRVKGSKVLPAQGTTLLPAGEARQPQVAPLVAAFQLGYQELGKLWGSVLPPQTLVALKRLAQQPPEAFGLDDVLWARIVYDFAVAYHLASMDRVLLLRSMVPLYLAWVAGYAREVREMDAVQLERRVESLCRAFELTKPYLIQRWRWPDRFNP